MNNEKTILNRLSEIRGTIGNDCIEIDTWLTVKLTDYFFKKNSTQKHDFYWVVIDETLERKILLFEKSSYFKKRKYYEKVKISLRSIQRLRNQLAHWMLIENKSNLDAIVLRNPHDAKDFTLTPNTLIEFTKHKEIIKEFLK